MCRICRNDPRFFAQVSFVSVVCRSSDLSIHVQRISPRTNALLQPSLGAMTALPMTDFHRTQISLHGSNTLEIQLFSEFCLHPSNPRFTDCGARQILSMSGTLTRFPCSANKHACPIVRVAHLPQKPCYVILGTIAVVSYESSFAKLAFFGKRCIRSFHCFLRKQGQLH